MTGRVFNIIIQESTPFVLLSCFYYSLSLPAPLLLADLLPIGFCRDQLTHQQSNLILSAVYIFLSFYQSVRGINVYIAIPFPRKTAGSI